MRCLKNSNLFSIVLVLLLGFYANATETDEIKALSTEIKIGEPLILKIKLTCKTPQIDSKTGEIVNEGGIKPYLILNRKGQKEEIIYKTEYDIIDKPLPIYDKQKKGLEYTASLFVFYDFMKEELFFKEPNEYTCRLESRVDKLKSNTIKINIKSAGKLEEKAMSILTGKFDIAILGMPSLDIDLKNSKEAKGIMDRYIQVVDQCEQTKIANMASAMLGLQYFKDFHKAHPSFEKFKEEYKSGNIWEPLFEQSQKYLTIGSKLPDEFPIRPVVLFQLSRIEFMKNNVEKSISFIEEVSTKYSNTEYGKKAIRALQEEIPKLKADI